jgi:hypothetical protein
MMKDPHLGSREMNTDELFHNRAGKASGIIFRETIRLK